MEALPYDKVNAAITLSAAQIIQHLCEHILCKSYHLCRDASARRPLPPLQGGRSIFDRATFALPASIPENVFPLADYRRRGLASLASGEVISANETESEARTSITLGTRAPIAS